MQEEQEPIQTKTPEEEPAPAEPKPGKKSKADKKRSAATTRSETEQPPEPEVAQAASPELEPPLTEPVLDQRKPDGSSDPAHTLLEQGIQFLLHGNYTEAGNLYSQALALRQKSGDRAGQAQVLEQLGHLAFLRGETQPAQEYYRQASVLRGA